MAEARNRFLKVWDEVRDETVQALQKENVPQEAVDWYRRSLDYNTPGGKLNRGLSVPDSLEEIYQRPLSDDEYKKAAILGWCIELLQAYFLVADDMMDASITRRGQPCWYRVKGVGNIAINDAFMLEAAIYYILKLHFRKESYYVDLFELFQDVTFKTEMGQQLDLLIAPEDDVDLGRFSLDKHSFIVKYKTAFYSFYLSVALAMHVAGIADPAAYKKAEDILIEMGEYFQVQDDYLDCYGTPEQIGKIGTDIYDNKCSWNINTAIKHATPEQRAVLDANYGRKNAENEAKVKEVFEEIGIRKIFEQYEADSYDRITKSINSIPESGLNGLTRGVFLTFLKKVYKRQK